MKDTEIFFWGKDYKKPSVLPRVTMDSNFYNVDKESLDKFLTKKERTSSVFVKELQSNKVKLQNLHWLCNSIVNTTAVSKPSVHFTPTPGINRALLSGEAITLSTGPMFDWRIDLEERVNNIAANAFHEALHVKYTTPDITKMLIERGYTLKGIDRHGREIILPNNKELGKILPDTLFANLHNILEDRRIESLGTKLYPGYVYYLESSRQYALQLHTINIEDRISNAKTTPEKFEEILFSYILYKVLLPEFADTFKSESYKHFLKSVDIPRFNSLIYEVDSIVSKSNTNHEELYAQVIKLRELFPKDYKQKDIAQTEMRFFEVESGSFGDMNKDYWKLVNELTEPNQKEKKVKLKQDKKQFKGIETLKVVKKGPGRFEPAVYNAAKTLSRKFSKNLTFVESRYNRVIDSYEMNSGDIDESELHAIKKNKFIFFQEEDLPSYNVDFGILVDESGSMNGQKIIKAQIATLALALALKDSSFLNLFIWGHTANVQGCDVLINDYYNSEEQGDIRSLFQIAANSNNADGFAIQYCGDLLLKRNSNKKVLVVISDGYPMAINYSGAPAESHVKTVVEGLERRGVFVIQIAIDGINSERMFKHFVPYSETSLVEGFTKLLKKQLIEAVEFV